MASADIVKKCVEKLNKYEYVGDRTKVPRSKCFLSVPSDITRPLEGGVRLSLVYRPGNLVSTPSNGGRECHLVQRLPASHQRQKAPSGHNVTTRRREPMKPLPDEASPRYPPITVILLFKFASICWWCLSPFFSPNDGRSRSKLAPGNVSCSEVCQNFNLGWSGFLSLFSKALGYPFRTGMSKQGWQTKHWSTIFTLITMYQFDPLPG